MDKTKLSTKEIAKIFRTQFKEEFKNCKFSVTKDINSIRISLMSADFEPFTELGKEKSTISVNHYYINESKYLTDEARKVFLRVYEITEEYNYDNSDSSVDYFDVNFYLHLEIGKWDRPFILKEN